jgi:hypothetical protein
MEEYHTSSLHNSTHNINRSNKHHHTSKSKYSDKKASSITAIVNNI